MSGDLFLLDKKTFWYVHFVWFDYSKCDIYVNETLKTNFYYFGSRKSTGCEKSQICTILWGAYGGPGHRNTDSFSQNHRNIDTYFTKYRHRHVFQAVDKRQYLQVDKKCLNKRGLLKMKRGTHEF
uniref:Uncharacterized protein n=1 Tax=Clytia hemisphaerica TaxID=252671 RepID=A0A7M5UEB4_9CNID